MTALESLAPANHEHDPENKNREEDDHGILQKNIKEREPQPKKFQTCHIRFPSRSPDPTEFIDLVSDDDHGEIETHPGGNGHNEKQTALPNQQEGTWSQNDGLRRNHNQRITPKKDEMEERCTTFLSNRMRKRIGWFNQKKKGLARGRRTGAKRAHPSREFNNAQYARFMDGNPWQAQNSQDQHQGTSRTGTEARNKHLRLKNK